MPAGLVEKAHLLSYVSLLYACRLINAIKCPLRYERGNLDELCPPKTRMLSIVLRNGMLSVNNLNPICDLMRIGVRHFQIADSITKQGRKLAVTNLALIIPLITPKFFESTSLLHSVST